MPGLAINVSLKLHPRKSLYHEAMPDFIVIDNFSIWDLIRWTLPLPGFCPELPC